ncbi:hypothetical protein [Alkalibacter mobilis]|uniref:hypothetical protein n=1 Tax=Alkalibacter mobilis TaxID=2787712 RepID=UPI00189FAEFC|nr:hypothetical protein [Alkalibacter mobilis]MBF7097600.1 hypothetical protein [Alkalibacter mobilis]
MILKYCDYYCLTYIKYGKRKKLKVYAGSKKNAFLRGKGALERLYKKPVKIVKISKGSNDY